MAADTKDLVWTKVIELEDALKPALPHDGPSLVEIRTDPELV